ncbi:MAG: PDZ domain-containing protein [Acidobacteria bacterium]|nr:PDZ domain-containing protein [Acidobacteriota bacterium]
MTDPHRSRRRLSGRRFRTITMLLAVAATALTAQTRAQSVEPVAYTVRFPAPHTHYAEVDASIPTDGRDQVEVMMAVWTPGSYLVREFARHVEMLSARSPAGERLNIAKSRKNRWTIDTLGAARIELSYRVYAREMSVRTNWVESDFAMLNGAPTFLTLADDAVDRPHDITLELPDGWTQSLTGLAPRTDRGPHAYRAADFDALVDSPIVAGNPAVYEFTVEGIRHALVHVGESGAWDGPASAADVQNITTELFRMWGDPPYDEYVFLNLITEAGGGLEHRNSTLLMTSRWAPADRESYLSWLALVSHEQFHAWNVKHLRPQELGPFDYENEVHTQSLWIVEGITSYYADLIVRRAELSTTDEYLDALSGQIRSLQTTPGREVQPVALASYDAWIKYYRADENSANTSVSYYTKGAVIGFLLDMRIRAATGGRQSLDDLMRLAYERFSVAQGYTPEEFRAAAEEVAGQDLSAWFARALDSTEELEYQEALEWLGLEFTPVESDPEAEPDGWIGLVTRVNDGQRLVSQVRRDTPGYSAGFNVGDELLGIDDYRVLPGEWEDRVKQSQPGVRISVLVSRRGALRRVPVEVGAQPVESWDLAPVAEASDAQEARREAWLSGR